MSRAGLFQRRVPHDKDLFSSWLMAWSGSVFFSCRKVGTSTVGPPRKATCTLLAAVVLQDCPDCGCPVWTIGGRSELAPSVGVRPRTVVLATLVCCKGCKCLPFTRFATNCGIVVVHRVLSPLSFGGVEGSLAPRSLMFDGGVVK